MRGKVFTFTERINRDLVERYVETLPKPISKRICLNSERIETSYEGVIAALKRAGSPVKDFFLYAGLSDKSTPEIDLLVELLKRKSLEEIIKLKDLFFSMLPEHEGYPIPMTPSDKLIRLTSRRQFSREGKKVLEEATGIPVDELQNMTKFPMEIMTQYANAVRASVHYILGLDEEPFYCEKPYADLVIDWYLLLPDYIKPYALSLLGGEV